MLRGTTLAIFKTPDKEFLFSQTFENPLIDVLVSSFYFITDFMLSGFLEVFTLYCFQVILSCVLGF